jgi:hypothetical protein
VDRRMVPHPADLHQKQESSILQYHIALDREIFRERWALDLLRGPGKENINPSWNQFQRSAETEKLRRTNAFQEEIGQQVLAPDTRIVSRKSRPFLKGGPTE